MLGFKKKIKIKRTGRIIKADEHSSWGDNIGVMDWKTGKIYGHMPNRPNVGDEVQFKMESGKIGRVIVVSVDKKTDPSDMFFADVKPLGYVGEKEYKLDDYDFL